MGHEDDENSRKKRAATVVICSFLLVAMVVAVAVGINDDLEEAENGSKNEIQSNSKAVHSFCQPTDFQKTCEEEIKKEVKNRPTDPKELTKIAFDVAIKFLREAEGKSETIAKLENDPRTVGALETCRKLMNFSINELQKSFEKIDKVDLSQIEKMAMDLRVWLSATITNEKTCLDGFENTTSDAGEKMKKALNVAIQMSQNGLAIIDEMAHVFEQLEGGGKRRRLFGVDDEMVGRPRRGRRLMGGDGESGHGDVDGNVKHPPLIGGEDMDDLKNHEPVLGHGISWYETIDQRRRLLMENEEGHGNGNVGGERQQQRPIIGAEDKDDLENHDPVLGHGMLWYEKVDRRRRRLMNDDEGHGNVDEREERRPSIDGDDNDDLESRQPVLGHGILWYETVDRRKRRLMSDGNALPILGHGEPWFETLGFPVRKLLGKKNRKWLKPTMVVAQDGSGQFKTINEAIATIPKGGQRNRTVIYIKEGIYREKIIVDYHMTDMAWIGDGPTKTRIINDLSYTKNLTTFNTATVSVYADFFYGRGIGFENTAGPQGLQAVALLSMSDFSVFYKCEVTGYQDSLYVHSKRQFFRDCTISGTIDYVFGNAAVVFQNCTFISRVPLPGQQIAVTANGKCNQREVAGIVIQNSTFSAEPGYDRVKFPAFLGRPWCNFSTAVIIESYIGDFINPEGWAPWEKEYGKKTCFYAEFNNTGPGALTSGRVKWPGIKTLSAAEIEKYTPGKFIGADGWVRQVSRVPYVSGFIANQNHSANLPVIKAL